MEMSFTILGQPVGKQRPRVTSNKGFAQTYTPEKTVNYESLVRLEYARQCGGQRLCGAVDCQITAYCPIPKSAPKYKRKVMETGKARHTRKPDVDNIAKVICDALNEVAFSDDSSISDLLVRKRYGKEPRVESGN
jgi:Holliday junction resolvase RusA-like endonuclease